MFSTGIPELDTILGGGYLDKSAILVVGASGSGKETLAYRFVKAGGTQGDRCLYITELSKNDVLADMRAHSVELEPSSLTWIAAEQNDRRFQPDDLPGLSFGIKDYISHGGEERTRVVVHSLSSLLAFNAADSVYRFLAQLLPELRKRQICLLAALEEGMHDSKTVASMEQLFDGVLEMKHSESENAVFVKLKKMRGSDVQANLQVMLSPAGGPAVGSRIVGPIQSEGQRKLAAIMFTDIVGYTARTQANEARALEVLAKHNEILRPLFGKYRGTEIKTIGDSFLVEFDSALEATLCAAEAQKLLHDYNGTADDAHKVEVRIGIHLGDVIRKDNDVFGDAVNIASRIQPLAEPEGICISEQVYDQVHNKIDYPLEEVEHPKLKNVSFATVVYRVVMPWEVPTKEELVEGEQAKPTPTNLPKQIPLIGRKSFIESAWPIILRRDVRLLTLTGPGGIGKSVVGIEVARSLLESFPNGVYFVPLASISDPELVLPTIAETVGVKEAPKAPLAQTLKNYIGEKHMLLVLDNFEQLASSSSQLLTELGDSCPKLKFIVTSRKPLRIKGEHELAVPPLSVPSLKKLPPLGELYENDSIALFLERARAIKPDLEISDENAQELVEICVRLDGLPLALELAAARIRILPPRMILTRLESRLGFLTGGSRDAPGRQQTLRNTIAWSHDLLDESEKKLFRRLAVFVGGFTVEAAESICPIDGDLNVLDGISALLDNSLLKRTDPGVEGEKSKDGEYRFGYLETIRDFASECLKKANESEAIETGRTNFYLSLAQKAEPRLNGPASLDWLARLEFEHDNMRASLGWCVERKDAERSLRLAGALGTFWEYHSYLNEGRHWLDAVLKIEPNESSIDVAKVLVKAGILAVHQGDYSGAKELFHQAKSMSYQIRDRNGVAQSLRGLAFIASRLADYSKAAFLYEESANQFRELHDDLALANSLKGLGWSLHNLGDTARAKSILKEGLEVYRKLGDKYNLSITLHLLAQAGFKTDSYGANRSLLAEALSLAEEVHDRRMIGMSFMSMGELARLHGNDSEAIMRYKEGIVILEDAGERSMLAWSCQNLGYSLLHEKQSTEAKRCFVKGLKLFRDLKEEQGMASCLAGFGAIALAQGSPERAARILGATSLIFERSGSYIDPIDKTEFEKVLSTAKVQLSAEQFSAEQGIRKSMSLNQVVAYCLEEQ